IGSRWTLTVEYLLHTVPEPSQGAPGHDHDDENPSLTPRRTHHRDSHPDFSSLPQLLHRHLSHRDRANRPRSPALHRQPVNRPTRFEHAGGSGLHGAWDKARLVLSGGHPLRQFTDEMADEHVGFLDAGHRRGWDADGDISGVSQFPLLP